MVTLDNFIDIGTPLQELTPEFENQLWKAADKLRKKVEVHQYKYIVLGFIFLRYLTYAFYERREELKKLFADEESEYYIDEELRDTALEDEDYYLEAGVFYIPEEARWNHLVRNANKPNIAEIIERAIEILEEKYPGQLRDVIPKVYVSSNLDQYDLSYLINLFSKIDFGYDHKASDIFGRIYEYFLDRFTEVEGKRGGKFFTPRSLTRLIVEILDIKGGRMFDPACGSGGFFVSAIAKLEREGIDKAELSIYGQDSDQMAWKLTKMNLTIRGVERDIRIGDSYHDDKFFDMRFDYVTSNPPFNDSEWGAERIKPDDPRSRINGARVPVPPKCGFSTSSTISPLTKAGFVMANGRGR